MTKEWLREWTKAHCNSSEEIEEEKNLAVLEASESLKILDGIEITTKPIIFDCRQFKTPTGFSTALFMAAEKYKGNADNIIVRYAKPENKKTGEAYIQFHILKEIKKEK